MNKVHNGTPISKESLCLSCRSAAIVRGSNFELIAWCAALRRTLNFTVERCSIYDDKATPPLFEMQAIAWNIQSRKRGQMGYVGDDLTSITIEPPERHTQQMPASLPWGKKENEE